MFGTMLTIVKIIIVAIFLIVAIHAAPKRTRNSSKNSSSGTLLSYDQKQTGDYNIRLHLKDFQVIALLNDGDFGDYDYNYDYADLTVKPILPSLTSTTKRPNRTISTTAKPIITTDKLSTESSKPLSEDTKPTNLTSAKPNNIGSEKPLTAELEKPSTENEPEKLNSTTDEKPTSEVVPITAPTLKSNNTADNKNSLNSVISNNSTNSTDSEIIFLHNNTKPLSNETLIAVQVLYDAINRDSLVKSISTNSQNSAINDFLIEEDDVIKNKNSTKPNILLETTSNSSLDENRATVTDSETISKSKRCTNGFRKDKLGRCRRYRYRRPGIHAQLARLASKIRKNGSALTKSPKE